MTSRRIILLSMLSREKALITSLSQIARSISLLKSAQNKAFKKDNQRKYNQICKLKCQIKQKNMRLNQEASS
jgi:hypothetical protein